MNKVSSQLDNKHNHEILHFIDGSSCHSDIIEPIDKILRQLPDVQWYCPDPHNFAFCCWHTNSIIFAYGTGMQEIGIRLPTKHSNQDKRPGVFVGRFDNNEWWSVAYDLPSIEQWALMAYDHAKTHNI